MVARKEALIEGIADREIVLKRLVDAPRELVWEAWVNPNHVVNWWGPNGFTTTIEKMDVRSGGEWRHMMRGPDGTHYPNESIFTDVVKPERIVYSHVGGREGGPGSRFEATWFFEPRGNKTQVTIHMIFPSAADRDTVIREYKAIEGGNQTLARLGEYVTKISATTMAEHDFVIARVLDAPRDLVFEAFTDPGRMSHWWGPKGYTLTASKMDLRSGGTYLYGLITPEGGNIWGKFIYREIVKPERLLFVSSFSDKAGNITRHPMSPNWPLQLLSTITFDKHNNGTLLTIRWALLPSSTAEERRTFNAAHDEMRQGWTGTLDKLTAYLEKLEGRKMGPVTAVHVETSGNSATFTSVLEAPRSQIFEAWTNSKHIPNWMLGPEGWTMPVCESDPRPYGTWHFVWRHTDGTEMEMIGLYKEVVPPERIVNTESWGHEWPETLNTLTLSEERGRTTITFNVLYTSEQARETALETGMVEGMAKSYDRLLEYLRMMAS